MYFSCVASGLEYTPPQLQDTVKPEIFATVLFSLISRVQKIRERIKRSENSSFDDKNNSRPCRHDPMSDNWGHKQYTSNLQKNTDVR